MAKILILIGAHICTAPRPQKEAEALANAGHDVTVAGFWSDPELVRRDRLLIKNKKWRFEPIINFQPHQKINNFLVRLRSRVAKEKFQKLGIFSPSLLGYGARAMLQYALKQKADLTIVHSESGLWVGCQLLDQGYKVGVDFEDWFSEDLLPEARASRPIKQLKSLENRLINECTYCLTTSHAMAEAMAEAYNSKPPTVIYNTFPLEDRLQLDGKICDRQNLNIPSIHWFSHTIGESRGLEILFQALPYINMPIEIHLRGNYPASSCKWLEPQVLPEWRNRIFIHSTVPNNELLSRIAEHDIGLALEVSDIPSRNLTITNKFFQYLQAGLALIATDTDGQKEVLLQASEAGILIKNNSSKVLADSINNFVLFPNKLKSSKSFSLRTYQEKYCWRNQVELLLAKANNAL